MAETDAPGVVREAVGYFKTPEALQDAIDELLSSGFDRAEVSLLASERTVDEKLGHHYQKVSELEDNAEVPRTFYIPNESVGGGEGALIAVPLYVAALATIGVIVTSGASLAATIAGAVLAGGAGGAIGTALAALVGQHHARYLEEQLEHGGLLLWVRTWDAADERRAVDIMKRHSGQDVHVHDLRTLA